MAARPTRVGQGHGEGSRHLAGTSRYPSRLDARSSFRRRPRGKVLELSAGAGSSGAIFRNAPNTWRMGYTTFASAPGVVVPRRRRCASKMANAVVRELPSACHRN